MRSFLDPSPDLTDKSVLVTGGTGSFGQHFVRTVLKRFKVKRLVVFSRDELKQYEMLQTIPEKHHATVRFFLGDVRDMDRLEMAMREVDIVIHTAALKQVPAAEYNPFECIHTNVLGAENVVRAALRTGVKQVVALSTDKAANPINLYGASKLASDKIFVAANNIVGSLQTRFAVVRYGNVVGSRGSVVPLYRRLAADGAERLPITDERMTRFWITLEQGVAFVLSSLSMMRGGEIFVPKIPSVKIVDLGREIAPELPHQVIGIRPGEKIHEVMISEDDARSTLEMEDRFVITPAFNFWDSTDYLRGGATAVAADFRYASDTNDERLEGTALQGLLSRGV